MRMKRIANLNRRVVKLNSSPAIFLDFYPFTTQKKKKKRHNQVKAKKGH